MRTDTSGLSVNITYLANPTKCQGREGFWNFNG